MKKIYYLLAFVTLALSACQKEPALNQVTVIPPIKQTLTLTLQTSDYQSLPSGYPKTTFTIDDAADAGIYVPEILNKEYSTAADGSTATVTYTQSSLYFKPDADSLYSDVYYQLTSSDYGLDPNYKNYGDFSAVQVQGWLSYKYTTPVNNQLALINFVPYPTTLTPAPPYSYLYYQGTWKQIYTIQPAQYTQAGVGKYDQFTTSNSESSLVATFNYFLKNDLTIIDTVKKNDIVFVSFDYYANATAYQRVKPLQFDGNNFVAPYTTTATISLVKASGSWGVAAAPAGVNHTLTPADETLISNSSVGGTALATYRSYVSKYGDFDVGAGEWTLPLLDQAFILVLQADYPTPQSNIPYNITYNVYTNSVDVPTVATFTWNGTTWVASQ